MLKTVLILTISHESHILRIIKTAQNENVILTETYQVLPSLLRSTNQAAGELEGLLPCTATETGGFVCIRSYSVVEDEVEGGQQSFSTLTAE